jgi:primosomal protein N' (replication factor Y)
MSYAAVFPLVRTRAFAGAFDYLVPDELEGRLVVGALVAVPLGAQTIIGVVLELRPETAHKGRVLPVRDLLDVPAIPADLLELARRVEQYYLTSFAAALTLVCPPTGALKIVRQYELTAAGRAARGAGEAGLDEVAGLKLPAGDLMRLSERYRRKGWLRIAYRVHVVGVASAGRSLRLGGATPARLGPRQRAALQLVQEAGVLDERSLRAVCGVSLPALRRLIETGALVEVAGSETLAGPVAPATCDGQPAQRRAPVALGAMLDLLPEQQAALRAIMSAARPGEEVLVHGVTGSGKTEVYLRAAQAALEGGRSVLMLVPEIGLTRQTVTRVRERFADERVAVLHSGLSAGERLLAYREVARGKIRLVVGARSAVFAPLVDLGLIIVDEEHDTSYKQESEPAYDARTVARWRAETSGAVVVLGSATPSVESYARVVLHADLPRRVDGSLPPALEIIDMRDHHGVFSPQLAEALVAAIDGAHKAILFLNRRGFASYLLCDHCGHVWECPRCDVALTFFERRGLRCRTCGYAEPVPAACPSCSGLDLVRHGVGTERVEQEVKRLVPGVELLRLDSDAASSHARLNALLERFAECGAKVMVGTQMIAKGHHFPDVTLVGVVNADLTMYFPDFRAEERTFAMLVQVGGRSGRGAHPGRVLVQTLNPEARPIALAAGREEERFYAEEVERRRELSYPPSATIVAFELSGTDERKVTLAGRFTAERLSARLDHGEQVLGPGPLWRSHGRHACRVVVKSTQTGETLESLRVWLEKNRQRFAERGVRLVPDVDPQWL